MGRLQIVKLLGGLILVFALFHWIATMLGSGRGEAGITVGVIVGAVTIAFEMLLFQKPLRDAARFVGIGMPAMRGMSISAGIGIGLLLTVPIFAVATGSVFTFYPGWWMLLAGLFFQGGIAEEMLFRGYLFRHIRERHNYWRAASMAAVPFVLVHFILFFTNPWPIAAASILLAVVMSFPLSRLFEMAGNTIWAPAVVHFVAQAGVKLLIPAGEQAGLYPFYWIVACGVVPFSVFLFPLGGRSEGTAHSRK